MQYVSCVLKAFVLSSSIFKTTAQLQKNKRANLG